MSAADEIAYGLGSLAWQRQWGTAYVDFGGMAPIWSFSGPDWLKFAVMRNGTQFQSAFGSAGGHWVDYPVHFAEDDRGNYTTTSRHSQWVTTSH